MKNEIHQGSKISSDNNSSGVDCPVNDNIDKHIIRNGIADADRFSSGDDVERDGQNVEDEIEYSPNCWADRKGAKIEAIVIHITDGSIESAINTVMNPASQVSYHGIIDNKGHYYDIVPDEKGAWHAGRVINPAWARAQNGQNPNEYTLGIALAKTEKEEITLQQYIGLIMYIKSKCEEYNIPIDKKHVVPHNWIHRGKTCPGKNFDMEKLLSIANLPHLPM